MIVALLFSIVYPDIFYDDKNVIGLFAITSARAFEIALWFKLVSALALPIIIFKLMPIETLFYNALSPLTYNTLGCVVLFIPIPTLPWSKVRL